MKATQDYVAEVQGRTFPAPEHTFKPNRDAESGPRVSEQASQGNVVSLRH